MVLFIVVVIIAASLSVIVCKRRKGQNHEKEHVGTSVEKDNTPEIRYHNPDGFKMEDAPTAKDNMKLSSETSHEWDHYAMPDEHIYDMPYCRNTFGGESSYPSPDQVHDYVNTVAQADQDDEGYLSPIQLNLMTGARSRHLDPLEDMDRYPLSTGTNYVNYI